MIDPFVSLFMPQEDRTGGTHNDATNYITVEEAIDCRNSNSRYFSLLNKESQLGIIISDNSTLTSCNLAGQEIVVDRNLYNETHETWAIGERPFQKLTCLPWTSHVRGSELILSSHTNSMSNNNPHTSLHFELTRSNELHCVAKLKTIHLQHQVIYYNLNQQPTHNNLNIKREKTPIDGHTIVVKCNGNLGRIQTQPTKLLCHCNKTSPILPQLLIGDIPYELFQQHSEDPNSDDLILCDAIYCLESYIGSPDYLQAQLQFQNRNFVFEVRSAKSAAAVAIPAHQNGNVSSSSSSSSALASASAVATAAAVVAAQLPQQNDLKQLQASPPSLMMNSAPAHGETSRDDSVGTSSSTSRASAAAVVVPTRMKLEPLDSTSSTSSASCNRSADISTSHCSTMLRIRVRVTNFGVSILPIMMTNYATSLSFSVL